MNESNSIKAIDKTNLSEQTKFRLSEIIGIENYFYQEINQRKSCSKKLSKYVTAFDYIDKILIVLSTTSSGNMLLLYINDLPDDVICNIAICADDTTLCSKCDQASDLWQQLICLLNLNLIYKTLWTGVRRF